MKKLLCIVIILLGVINSVTPKNRAESRKDIQTLVQFKNFLLHKSIDARNIHFNGIVSKYGDFVLSTCKEGTKGMNYYNEELNQEWNGAAWENQDKELFYYNASGWNTEQLMLELDGAAWVNAMRNVITNNANGIPEYMMIQMWNAGSWVDMGKMTFTMNGQGLIAEMLMQYYMGGSLVNFMKVTYSYNAQLLGTEVLEQEWDMVGSVWVNSYRTAYTYNAGNLCSEELTQIWENNAWVNEQNDYNTYDGGGHMTTKLSKSWGNNWQDYMRYTYTYNAQWLVTQELNETFGAGVWSNFIMTNNTYDAQNRIIEVLEKYWQGGAWENAEKSTWIYGIQTGIGSEFTPGNTVKLYPNPAGNFTMLSTNNPGASAITIRLIDLCGREMKTWNTPNFLNPIKIMLDEFEQGIYFIRVEQDNKMLSVEKITIVR